MIAALSLTPFDAAAILIVAAAALGWLNQRFLGLPTSIGLTAMGAIVSLGVVLADELIPGSRVGRDIVRFVDGLDFHRTLMDGMLSFLLFAGALQVDWADMRRGRWAILILTTVGVLASTAIVGGGFMLLTRWLGFEVPPIWCFVFGALISPTDPVSVMEVLKRTSVSPTLEATVAAESLFNDGVGVVVFVILLGSAMSGQPFSIGHAALLFAQEAGGGILLGLAIGWIAYRAIRSIDDYRVEVLVSLAVVMGGYALAQPLGVSGPVAMAVAGIMIGNAAVGDAMSDKSQDYLEKFWVVIDDILNAVLFLLIGLEAVAIPREGNLIAIGLACIPLVIAARAISVMLPLAAITPLRERGLVAPVTLIWGGLRGGISVALALGLPAGGERAAILTATYAVVLFTVIVQGGTIRRVLQWVAPSECDPAKTAGAASR